MQRLTRSAEPSRKGTTPRRDALAVFGEPDRHVSLARGDYLFRQEDPAAGSFVLENGRVRLIRAQPNGLELTLHRVSAGESFAEASVFGRRYHCDCRADTACKVGLYERERLRSQLHREPELALAWSQRLSELVRSQRTLLEVRSIPSARERILAFVGWLADGSSSKVDFHTLRSLASDLGLAEETVYRAIKELTRDGLVERKGAALALRPPAEDRRAT